MSYRVFRAFAAFLGASALLASSVSAADDVAPQEVQSYREDFGVSAKVAERNLERQHRGAGIVEQLEAAQGEDYAGVWFDNEAGEFVVPVTSPANQRSIRDTLAESELADAYRTTAVEFNWRQLEDAQERIDKALLPQIKQGLAMTGLDPRSNAVVIDQAARATAVQRAQTRDLASSSPAKVEERQRSVDKFRIGEAGCSKSLHACGQPLRGGVKIETGSGSYCTSAFKAVGNVYGNRFLLTAGHCADTWPTWYAHNTDQGKKQKIGSTQAADYIPHDWAAINVNGSDWDTNPWPSQVAFWGVDNQRPIYAESSGFIGLYVCHIGVTTDSNCGFVTGFDKTVPYGNQYNELVGYGEHTTEVSGSQFCVISGDSGGSVIAGNSAIGIISQRLPGNTCPNIGYFMEITEATDTLGVSVAPRGSALPSAETEAPSDNTNGRQITAKGKVDPNGASTSYRFEYGHTTGYGSSTQNWSAGSGLGASKVSQVISGLRPASAYHYRLVATNGNGTGYGNDYAFATPTAAPLATTGGTSDVKAGKGKLHGTVEPAGLATTYQFEWGKTTAYGNTAPAPAQYLGPTASGDYPVEAQISGLKGLTTYHYRLKAQNSKGTAYGQDKTFTTPDWRPGISGVGHSAPYVAEEAGKIDLQGKVNPRGFASDYRFEWGTEAEFEEGEYNNSIPVPDKAIGSGESDVSVEQTLSGIKGSTTYHYRLVAENVEGKTTGEDHSFTTPDWKPGITTSLSTGIGGGEATLNGKVNSKGFATTYRFEYGTTGGYGTNAPETPKGIGSAQEDVTVSEPLEGLTPDTTYYFRLVATNAEGTTHGPQRRLKEFVRGQTFGIDCTAADRCLRTGEAEGSSEARIEEWDGSAWSQLPVPAPNNVGWSTLNAVSCDSANACLAVGHYATLGSTKSSPFSVEWDGSEWSLRSVPLPEGATSHSVITLRDVSCSAASACTAVGFYGFVDSYGAFDYGRPWVARWNGSSWSEQSFPPPNETNEAQLTGVSCPTAGFCMAVGGWRDEWGSGEELTLAATWDGSQWSEEEALNPSELLGKNSFADVSCVSAEACTAVGRYAAWIPQLEDGRYRPLIERWNGSSWTQSDIATEAEEPELRGVSCRTANACVAVGANAWEETLVVYWSGAWAEEQSTDGELHAVSCPGAEECMATGRIKHPEPGFVREPLSLAVEGKSPPMSAPVFDFAAGTQGSGNGQLNSPRGAAVDSEGNLWVVDSLNHRIQKFDPDGEYLDQCGGKGSGNGELNEPFDLDLDGEGNVWVTDPGNQRVQKFDSDCEYLGQFGEAGSGDGQLEVPTGLAIDAEGNLWVADFVAARAQKFDPEGEYLDGFGEPGGGKGQLSIPFDLEIDAEGDIWVADLGNHRLQEFDPDGEYLSQFGSWGSGEGEFREPTGIAIDPSGRVWVGDVENGRVVGFSPGSGALTTFGEEGSGPGQFELPVDAAFTPEGDGIWVTDSGNGRLQRWNFPDAPDAVTGEATDVGETMATLNATVDPEGVATAYQFEYGATTEYGSTAPASPQAIGSGSKAIAVSEEIEGLNPGETYHFRVKATNSEGTAYGGDRTFTTAAAPHWTRDPVLDSPVQTGFSGTIEFTDPAEFGLGAIACQIEAEVTLEPGDAGTVDELDVQDCTGTSGAYAEYLSPCEFEEAEVEGLPWDLEAEAGAISVDSGSIVVYHDSGCTEAFAEIVLHGETLTLTPDEADSISTLEVSGEGQIELKYLGGESQAEVSGTLQMDEPGVYGIG